MTERMMHRTSAGARRAVARARAARASVAALAAASIAIAVGCAINPVTGSPQLMLVSEQEEKQIGRDADAQIVAQYGLVDRPDLAAYVDRVGQRLAAGSHRPDLGYAFRVLDDPVVNAFALPGGYVYLTRGILAHLPDEAAMAGVLGHEIGHVTARHGPERMTKATLLQLGIGVGALVHETFAEWAGLAGAASQLLLMRWGRDDERQADELGVEYATAHGFDTASMAWFFHTLDRIQPEAGRLPSWLSTHPDPGERYETVMELTAKVRAARAAPLEVGREDFVQKTDGLVFGPDPRAGFVKDGAFHHPDLGFRFRVPDGWTLSNEASRVVMASPGQDAVLLFGIANAPSAAQAARGFAPAGVRVIGREDRTTNGRPAAHVTSVGSDAAGDSVAIESTFIDLGGRVYVFHGLTAAGARPRFAPTFARVSGSLEAERDVAVQAVVLRAVRAPSSRRFREAVAAWPIPSGADADLERLALMNGYELDDVVPTGTPLKVLVAGSGR